MTIEERLKEIIHKADLLDVDADDIDSIVEDQSSCCDDRDDLTDEVRDETDNVRERAEGIRAQVEAIRSAMKGEDVEALKARIAELEEAERQRKVDAELRAAGLMT